MTHPAAVTIDDNPQLIDCHCTNIRTAVHRIATATARREYNIVGKLVTAIISNAQRVDQLAAQLQGAQTRDARRNQATREGPV